MDTKIMEKFKSAFLGVKSSLEQGDVANISKRVKLANRRKISKRTVSRYLDGDIRKSDTAKAILDVAMAIINEREKTE